MQSKEESTSIIITHSKARSKRRSSLVDTVIVDLEMDTTSVDPNKEQQGLADESSNQQVQEALNAVTTMIVRDGKETGTNPDKSQVLSRLVWLENMLSNKKRNIVPASIPVEDMVSKCLGKTPKAKKSKIMSKFDFDAGSGN